MARNILRETIQDTLKAKADNPKTVTGFLGDSHGVVSVPGKVNYVYVTLADGMVAEAYNTTTASIYHLPVICGVSSIQKRANVLEVLTVRNIPRPGKTDEAYQTDAHHASHEWMSINGSTDVIYVQLRQYMPLRPQPVAPYFVYIGRGMQSIGGIWASVGDVTLDLSSYVPTYSGSYVSGSGFGPYTLDTTIYDRFVTISLSSTTGSMVITSGSIIVSGSMTMNHIPAAPDGNYPICAVRLYTGQQLIRETREAIDLIDLRGAVFASPTLVHNALGGLQGGTTSERFHLTSAQADRASSSGSALNMMSDVSISGSQINDGALIWSSAQHKWVSSQYPLVTYDVNYTLQAHANHLALFAVDASGSGYSLIDGGPIPGGFVVGPPGATIHNIASFADTTGKLIEDSQISKNVIVTKSGSFTAGHTVVVTDASGSALQDGGLPGTGTISTSGSINDRHLAVYSGSSGTVVQDGGTIPLSGHVIFGASGSIIQRQRLQFLNCVAILDDGTNTVVSIPAVHKPTSAISGHLASFTDVSGSTIQDSGSALSDLTPNTGWVLDSTPWVYSGSATMTYSGADVSSRYGFGTKIKLTNSTLKKFYAISCGYSGGVNTLTINGGTDFSLASGSITDMYYSYSTPPDFPCVFNWNPALNLGGAVLSGYTNARFEIRGRQCHIDFEAENKTVSGSGEIGLGLPVLSSSSYWGNTHAFLCTIFQGVYIPVRNDVSGASNKVVVYKDITSAPWVGNETAIYIRIHGEYEAGN
jgi:hypothetical protein